MTSVPAQQPLPPNRLPAVIGDGMILDMSLGNDACEVFLDARGNGRALRLTWHHDADVVVLSLWRDGVCAGTFRLPKAQVNDFIDALVDGLCCDDAGEQRAPGAHAAPPPHTGAHAAAPSFMSWAFEEVPGRRANVG